MSVNVWGDTDVIASRGASGKHPPSPLPRRLHQVFEKTVDRSPQAIALEVGDEILTYADLEVRANRLAHVMREAGVRHGSRVAILLERSVDMYVALLATGKSAATFVPIDPGSPADRVAYIVDDSGSDLVVTSTALADSLADVKATVLDVRHAKDAVSVAPAERPDLSVDDRSDSDPDAYIIYTSGSTGRPKGVLVSQASICNYLDVIPGVYDVRPADRVYQGLSISFDFSLEEIWPTWAVGATLVAGPTGSGRVGADLADFLEAHRISLLYCVPTLLATIPRDLPGVRSLIVGGEACPAQLVERWSRPERRMLNTYGPTETTITALWCEMEPGRPVVIGRPVPTYTTILLDEHGGLVPEGEVGEVCIGGPGVARGYVGRPDLTAEKFIDHPAAPDGGKLYRSGDLGRVTETGDIEYLGRADSEVKIRGHRVDLGEIESVLLEDPAVGAAVAALQRISDDPDSAPELAAYVTMPADEDVPHVVARLHDRLRDRVPAYMIPAFLDILPALPTMSSGKVDRKQLPAPENRLHATTTGPVVSPATAREVEIAAVWAKAFGIAEHELSVEADFFTELGGHSLIAATVVSRLRAENGETSLGVRDLYAHPTVRALAAQLDSSERPAAVAAPPRVPPLRHRTSRLARAGAVQSGWMYLMLLVAGLPLSYVYATTDGALTASTLGLLVISMLVTYVGIRWVLPPLLVRPLSAGIKPGLYPLWGVTYLRLWAVDRLLATSALGALNGSAFMAPYLRLLGAKVGPRTTVQTAALSLPRLLDIGADATVGYGSTVRPWKVEDGWVLVAPITIGADAFVAANTVLDPGTGLENGAALAAQSVLSDDETIPAGARWSGSPARPVESLDPAVETLLAASNPKTDWRFGQLVATACALVGLELTTLASTVPVIVMVWTAWAWWGIPAAIAATLLGGPVFVLTVCAMVAVGKRLVLANAPAGTHTSRSALGIRKWYVDKLLEFSLTFTNPLYSTLYTAGWLRLLGARIGRRAEVSTVSHLDPELLTIGDESFVADMATVGAAAYANGHFVIRETRVGDRAFVGNSALIPAGVHTGDNSLVGVASVPSPAGVPVGTSWLGSPAMLLPNRQDSGSYSEDLTFRPTRRRVTHRLFVEFFRATLPPGVIGLGFSLYLLALSQVNQTRDLALLYFSSPVLMFASSLLIVAFCAAMKYLVIGVYRPRVEPLWSTWVRRSEFVTGLYEAAAVPAGVSQFVGTPFLAPVLRLFGARVGRRTWIGTTFMTEFDLVRIGDDAVVGTNVSLQTHLFEDRVMKMSTVTVDAGATVGTRSVILYDATVGAGGYLGSLSLLMKGEELSPDTRWRGIPTHPMETRPRTGLAKR